MTSAACGRLRQQLAACQASIRPHLQRQHQHRCRLQRHCQHQRRVHLSNHLSGPRVQQPALQQRASAAAASAAPLRMRFSWPNSGLPMSNQTLSRSASAASVATAAADAPRLAMHSRREQQAPGGGQQGRSRKPVVALAAAGGAGVIFGGLSAWAAADSGSMAFHVTPSARQPAGRMSSIAAARAAAGGNTVVEGAAAPPSAGNGSASVKPSAATPAAGSGYALPPPEILEIVDREPNPALSLSPMRDRVLFLHRPPLPPIDDLARPELKLAGVRIDPDGYTRSRMSSYTGISVHVLRQDDDTLGESWDITGLPAGAKINFVSWSPDGRRLAFTVRGGEGDGQQQPEGRRLSLWTADVATGKASKVIGAPDYFLNTVFDSYVWVDNDTIVALVSPFSQPGPPAKPLVPPGPKVSDNSAGAVAQARTFTDLLEDEHDGDVLQHYATTLLLSVSVVDGTSKVIGEPKMYLGVEPSNDERYLLVTEMKRPFSLEFPAGRFPKSVYVLRAHDGAHVQTIADLPLADSIPVTFNSVRTGRRSIGWRADMPSTLCWVETQDGGDAQVEVSPRDIVYTLPAEPSLGVEPEVLHTVDLRYGGVTWGNERLALVYENWFKTRRTRTWTISPGSESEGAPQAKDAKVLFDRSYEDRYSDPGSPMLRRTPWGAYVLAQVQLPDGSLRLLLSGDGATPEGNIPFLDLLDVETGATERIWRSDSERYLESISSILSDVEEGPIPMDKLKVLLVRESKEEPPQYFIKRWRDGSEVQLTDFPHPYPSLRGLQKEIIKYERADGVQLTATLYLPPGYDAQRDGPLPMLMWAYPREFKSKDAAGQVRGSPNQFAGIGASSPLLFLARGYAVLSGPSMPIIGEGDKEANDSFVEQLVASAEAAVEDVVRRGVADRKRIAVGGHSYGAFMAANLIAHAPHLFVCAIAQSGAYNRTLTPFSFQAEERTLWQARDVYLTMSPFFKADVIKTPVLLVHGQDDNNAGTFPMQTERFFAALKGHGVASRMVLLPHEGHGYRARESLLHVLAEQAAWLDRYCGSRADQQQDSSAEEDDAAAAAAPEPMAVAAAVGAAAVAECSSDAPAPSAIPLAELPSGGRNGGAGEDSHGGLGFSRSRL